MDQHSKYYSNKDQNKHSRPKEHIQSYANSSKEIQPCQQPCQGSALQLRRVWGELGQKEVEKEKGW